MGSRAVVISSPGGCVEAEGCSSTVHRMRGLPGTTRSRREGQARGPNCESGRKSAQRRVPSPLLHLTRPSSLHSHDSLLHYHLHQFTPPLTPLHALVAVKSHLQTNLIASSLSPYHVRLSPSTPSQPTPLLPYLSLCSEHFLTDPISHSGVVTTRKDARGIRDGVEEGTSCGRDEFGIGGTAGSRKVGEEDAGEFSRVREKGIALA
jgi:hypothetical protein